MLNRRTFYSYVRFAWRYPFMQIIRFRFRGDRYCNWRRWLRWRPPLLVAISAGFSFQEKGISNEVIGIEKALHIAGDQSGEWEMIVEQDDLRVVRRTVDASGLCEYRCSGTYRDISARDFVDAQIDLDYRQKWDTNVLKLELLYSDEETDSEVIRWIAKFPYPMYPREYIYVRRRYIDEDEQRMVIASSALHHKLFPVSSKYVRVQTYRSVMVVRAHGRFEEKGLDFVLTYYDNPESSMPSYAYNWVINYGGPHFLQQVHAAALRLEELRSQGSLSRLEAHASEGGSNEEEGYKGRVKEGLIDGEEGVEIEEETTNEERRDLQDTPQSAKVVLQAWYDRLGAIETPEFLKLFD